MDAWTHHVNVTVNTSRQSLVLLRDLKRGAQEPLHLQHREPLVQEHHHLDGTRHQKGVPLRRGDNQSPQPGGHLHQTLQVKSEEDSVIASLYLPACPLACLSACPSAYLPVRLSTFLSVCLSVCASIYSFHQLFFEFYLYQMSASSKSSYSCFC